MEKRFVCRMCGCMAKIETLTKGVAVIECGHCELAEVFGDEQERPPEYFQDLRQLSIAC